MESSPNSPTFLPQKKIEKVKAKCWSIVKTASTQWVRNVTACHSKDNLSNDLDYKNTTAASRCRQKQPTKKSISWCHCPNEQKKCIRRNVRCKSYESSPGNDLKSRLEFRITTERSCWSGRDEKKIIITFWWANTYYRVRCIILERFYHWSRLSVAPRVL